MNRNATLATVHLVATTIMVGVIWYVQLVHYPLMAGWPHDTFGQWEAAHRARTGWIVMPTMLVEGLTAALLAARGPAGGQRRLAWVGGLLLLVVWTSTWLVQVPCHDALARGWDATIHTRLVTTNWIRTAAWTLRLAVASALLAAAVGPSRPDLRRAA